LITGNRRNPNKANCLDKIEKFISVDDTGWLRELKLMSE
jgi:hypothetical protein